MQTFQTNKYIETDISKVSLLGLLSGAVIFVSALDNTEEGDATKEGYTYLNHT